MKKNINIRTVKDLAVKLKIDQAKLEAALTTDETEEAKMEEKGADEIIPAELIIATKADFDKPADGSFIYNFQKTKYERGRSDALEVLVKKLKTDNQITDDSVKDLDGVLKAITAKAVEAAGVTPDKQVELLKKDKDTLQQKVTQLELEVQNTKKSAGETQTLFERKNKGMQALNSLNLDVDDTLAPGLKQLVLNAFLEEHEFQGDVIVNKSTGKALQDANLNNLVMEDALKQYVPKYAKIKDGTPGNGGRNDKSSSGSLPVGDIKDIKTRDQLNKYLDEKKISPSSDEGLAVYREVKKVNPDFK